MLEHLLLLQVVESQNVVGCADEVSAVGHGVYGGDGAAVGGKFEGATAVGGSRRGGGGGGGGGEFVDGEFFDGAVAAAGVDVVS